MLDLNLLAFALVAQLLIHVPDGRLNGVAGHDLHQRDGGLDVGIERIQAQYGLEHLGHGVAVQADEVARQARAGEVAVADDQLVAMTHFHKDLQQVGRNNRRNTLQHTR